MKISIKKYVATVAVFKEHEDGTITKEVKDITLEGNRFPPATVWKHIPREAKLIESGWRETAYEIDPDKLEAFLLENGTRVTAESVE